MKAPATRTATSGKPASAASRSGAHAARAAVAAPSPAKGSGKATSKSAPKAAAKATPAAKGKAAAPAKGKPAAKVAAPAGAKSSSKAVATKAGSRAAVKSSQVKPAPKAPAKTAARPGTKTTPKVSAKPATRPAAPQPAAKTVSKTPVAPAVAKVAAKAPAPRAAEPKSRAGGPASAVAVPAPKAPPPAPAVIEPSPKPLGKRAAKKIMMEQMTQAAVVPSHAPDAAKATFFTLNERPVMTPPVPSSIQKDPKRANNWKSLPVEQLTDQDILSMPDSEYMNDVQLAYFRRKLSQLKADMLANAGETTEHLREDTVVVPDPADRATIEEEHALELRTRDRERKLLKKIEQAIARIDGGDYGYCDETGEPIGVGRLMARPTASLSLEAQQRRELKQKMFGD